MKKMRGIIDPITLGFLISLIGATTAYTIHKGDTQQSSETETNMKTKEFVAVDSIENNDTLSEF